MVVTQELVCSFKITTIIPTVMSQRLAGAASNRSPTPKVGNVYEEDFEESSVIMYVALLFLLCNETKSEECNSPGEFSSKDDFLMMN